MQGDADNDDDVDGADFLTWQQQLGQTQAPGVAAIPEPASLWLAGVGMGLSCVVRRRRRQGDVRK
jgi:hypothetical protein